MGSVAVIDDSEVTLFLIQEILAQAGHPVKIFRSGLEFLEKYTQSDGLDLILSDVKMPDLTGLELIQKIKKIDTEIPIVLMTAYVNIDDAVKAIKDGAYDYIPKPTDNLEQFHLVINRALNYYRLAKQNRVLQKEIQSRWQIQGMVGKGPAIRKVLDTIQRISHSSANVLITGESGTGKELVARAIHQTGPRKNGDFVAINCAAIPDNLLESELFGHVKGSFTGAVKDKMGLFEKAHGGTLFLDEIGDLNIALQAKLLRVIQERKIRAVGSNQDKNIDVRLVAATHKNLLEEAHKGTFREDLFFRLNVIPIHLPPLRERKEDIPLLANFFLEKYAAIHNQKLLGLTKKAIDQLLNALWRGNIRELENVIERAVILCQGEWIDDLYWQTAVKENGGPALSMPPLEEARVSAPLSSGLSPLMGPSPIHSLQNTSPAITESGHALIYQDLPTLKELENRYVRWILERVRQNKDEASHVLGIGIRTLYRKLSLTPPLDAETVSPLRGTLYPKSDAETDKKTLMEADDTLNY